MPTLAEWNRPLRLRQELGLLGQSCRRASSRRLRQVYLRPVDPPQCFGSKPALLRQVPLRRRLLLVSLLSETGRAEDLTRLRLRTQGHRPARNDARIGLLTSSPPKDKHPQLPNSGLRSRAEQSGSEWPRQGSHSKHQIRLVARVSIPIKSTYPGCLGYASQFAKMSRMEELNEAYDFKSTAPLLSLGGKLQELSCLRHHALRTKILLQRRQHS